VVKYCFRADIRENLLADYVDYEVFFLKKDMKRGNKEKIKAGEA